MSEESAALFDRHGDRKYLNQKERRAFLDAARRVEDKGRRAFALLLYYSGCRVSEALGLQATSIDAADGTVVFRTLKQHGPIRYRAVPIPETLLKSLQALSTKGVDAPLWGFTRVTAWRFIRALMRSAGMTGVHASPKGLRHGFAVACISAGVPLPTVQKWLGHARLTTTSIYLNFVGEDERKLARRLWTDS